MQLGFAARRGLSSPVLLVSAFLLFPVGQTHAGSLYDVDFEAPVHTVGANPTLGAGPAPRKTPTEIFQSSPVVVAEPGILDGQSLRFTPSTDLYRQIQFSLSFPEQYPLYRFRSDLLFNNRIDTGALTVLVDSPYPNQVRFKNGRVSVAVSPLYVYEDVGAFSTGERLALDILVDRSAKWWSICLGGVQIHEGPYPLQGSIRMLRFSSYYSADLYLDNVRIEGLPEPGTLALGAAAGMLLLRRRRPSPAPFN